MDSRHTSSCLTVVLLLLMIVFCVRGEVRCGPGHANCDNTTDNGCEVNLNVSLAHCGACGVACHVGLLCRDGECVANCTDGFADCDGSLDNGCEADLRTNTSSCGRCGVLCAPGTTCVAGACTGNCAAGFGDCDSILGNGCETQLSSKTNCGGCGNTCGNKTVCAAGQCTPSNCSDGFADCDGLPSNGCEVNVWRNHSNCGACDAECPLGDDCVAGLCAAPSPSPSGSTSDSPSQSDSPSFSLSASISPSPSPSSSISPEESPDPSSSPSLSPSVSPSPSSSPSSSFSHSGSLSPSPSPSWLSPCPSSSPASSSSFSSSSSSFSVIVGPTIGVLVPVLLLAGVMTQTWCRRRAAEITKLTGTIVPLEGAATPVPLASIVAERRCRSSCCDRFFAASCLAPTAGFITYHPTGYQVSHSVAQFLTEQNFICTSDDEQMRGQPLLQLWQAKCSASPATVLSIAERDAQALHAYTVECDLYKVLNRRMREGDGEFLSSNEFRPFIDFIYHLSRALTCAMPLPRTVQYLYRGIGCRVCSSHYRYGAAITWHSFSSTTRDLDVALRFVKPHGTLFIITACKGAKGIATWSQYEEEEEWLYNHNTQFQVESFSTQRAVIQEHQERLTSLLGDPSGLEIIVLAEL